MEVEKLYCPDCCTWKDPSEFSMRKRVGAAPKPYRVCRKCWKIKYPDKTNNKKYDDFSRPEEQALVATLVKNGIFATRGRVTQFKRADVVAWGCVPIELKTSTVHKRGEFRFGFTVDQINGGLQADVIVLAFVKEDAIDYHVFFANDPLFFQESGRRKSTLVTTPNNLYNNQSALELRLADSKDAWDIIEDIRQNIINDLISGRK